MGGGGVPPRSQRHLLLFKSKYRHIDNISLFCSDSCMFVFVMYVFSHDSSLRIDTE